jgi:hypothetical protein
MLNCLLLDDVENIDDDASSRIMSSIVVPAAVSTGQTKQPKKNIPIFYKNYKIEIEDLIGKNYYIRVRPALNPCIFITNSPSVPFG